MDVYVILKALIAVQTDRIMSIEELISVATAGLVEPAADWMSAAQVRALIFKDPAVVWFEYHGRQHGFEPDTASCDFLTFISNKGMEFESKWINEFAPNSVRVCQTPREIASAEKVREPLLLMLDGAPVIAQPSLWWAPERVYGAPDLLVHTSWIAEKLPNVLSSSELEIMAPNLEGQDVRGHYVVLDVKFITRLEDRQKAKHLLNHSTQIRIYSYMLGHLQGYMPQKALLVTRDCIFSPLTVKATTIQK